VGGGFRLQRDFALRAVRAADAQHHGIRRGQRGDFGDVHPVAHGLAIHGHDLVAHGQAHRQGRTVGGDVADDGVLFLQRRRLADDPHDRGEQKGEDEIAERAGQGNDDFFPRGDAGKGAGFGIQGSGFRGWFFGFS